MNLTVEKPLDFYIFVKDQFESDRVEKKKGMSVHLDHVHSSGMEDKRLTIVLTMSLRFFSYTFCRQERGTFSLKVYCNVRMTDPLQRAGLIPLLLKWSFRFTIFCHLSTGISLSSFLVSQRVRLQLQSKQKILNKESEQIVFQPQYPRGYKSKWNVQHDWKTGVAQSTWRWLRLLFMLSWCVCFISRKNRGVQIVRQQLRPTPHVLTSCLSFIYICIYWRLNAQPFLLSA